MLRGWQRIADTVGQKRVPDVLRYICFASNPRYVRRRLFKLVRDRYKSARDVFSLLRVLEKRAELVRGSYSDPSHEYWVETPDARPYRCGTQAVPCNSDDAAVVCGLGEMVAARLCTDVETRIGGGVPVHGSEQVEYQRTGACIPSGEQGSRRRNARGPRGLFEQLRPIYVTTDKWPAPLHTWPFRRGALANDWSSTSWRDWSRTPPAGRVIPSAIPGRSSTYSPRTRIPSGRKGFREPLSKVLQPDRKPYSAGSQAQPGCRQRKLRAQVGGEYDEEWVRDDQGNFGDAPEEWTLSFLDERQRQLRTARSPPVALGFRVDRD